MSLSREKKEFFVESTRALISRSQFILTVGYKDIKFSEIEKLRRDLDDIAKVVFLKNTIAKIAFGEMFRGKTLSESNFFIFSANPIEASAKIKKFIEDHKCEVKVCLFDYSEIDPMSFKKLASLPTLEVARAQFCSALSSIIGNLHSTLSYLPKSLVMSLREINKEK